VEWDSSKAPGERVLGVWLLKPEGSNAGFDEEEISREAGGRKYKIVTREYLAQGHDGYEPLTKGRWLIDHECGSTFSSIVRSYLLGMFLQVKQTNLSVDLVRRLQESNLSINCCSQRTNVKQRSPAKHESSLILWPDQEPSDGNELRKRYLQLNLGRLIVNTFRSR